MESKHNTESKDETGNFPKDSQQPQAKKPDTTQESKSEKSEI